MVGLSRGLKGPDLRLAQAPLLRKLQCRDGQMRRSGQLRQSDPRACIIIPPLRGGVRGGGHARCLRSSRFACVKMRQVIQTARPPTPTLRVDPPRKGEGKAMRLWIAFMLAMVLLAARGHAAELATEIKALDTSNFAQKENAIAAIASTGDARVAAVMTALNDGTLLIRKSDRLIVIAEGKGTVRIENAATGEALGQAAEADLDKIAINNKIRRQSKVILGNLTLFSEDPAVRLKAADDIFRSRDLSALQPLKDAFAKEQDPQVKPALEQALAALTMMSDAPEAERLAAILAVKARGGQDAMSLLSSAAQGSDAVARAAAEALAALEQ